MNKSKRILSFAVMVVMLVSLLIPALSFADPKWDNDDKKGGPPAFVFEKLRDKFEFMDGNRIKFNGQNIKFDVNPALKGGRTLIPVRAIENMGAVVIWNPDNYVVTMTKDDIRIFMDLPNGIVYVTDADTEFDDVTADDIVTLDVRPGLINNRTFVPLRFIAETFGLRVNYNSDNGNIDVLDQPKLIPSKLTYETEAELPLDFEEIQLKLNDYTFVEIKDLVLGTDFNKNTDNTIVYLKRAFLSSLDHEKTTLTFVFAKDGESKVEKTLLINLSYKALEMPTLDKKVATINNEDDILVIMDPNDYTFSHIESNGVQVTDSGIEVDGNEVTFLYNTYLEDLTENTTYYFVFENTDEADVKIKFQIKLEELEAPELDIDEATFNGTDPITVEMTLNDYAFEGVELNSSYIDPDVYDITDDTLTFKKSYLDALKVIYPSGTSLYFVFSHDDVDDVEIEFEVKMN